MKLIELNGKFYRPLTYQEAKKQLLGKAIDFECELNSEECCCDDVAVIKSSYLVTGLTEDSIIVNGRHVSFIDSILLFTFMDTNKPLGVEVEVKDKKKSTANNNQTEEKK